MSADGPWKYFNCQWCCCEWRTFSGKQLSLCTYFPVSYPLDGGTAGQVLCVSSSASFYHSSLKIAVYPLSIGDTLILLTVRVLGISTIIPVFISLVWDSVRNTDAGIWLTESYPLATDASILGDCLGYSKHWLLHLAQRLWLITGRLWL